MNNGILGFKGETGYSAYEIAVKHGYTGTEEQWSEDFLNAENYYDKSEIDTLLNGKVNTTDVYVKGNFAVIQGSAHWTEVSTGLYHYTLNLSLPSGFSYGNTMIVAAQMGTASLPHAYVNDSFQTVTNVETFLGASKVIVSGVSSTADPSDEITCRVLVMKVVDDSL